MLWPSRRKALPVAVSCLAAEVMAQGRERERERTGVHLARESAGGTQETLCPRVSVCPMARPGPGFAIEQGICLRVPALDAVEDCLA